MYRRWGFYIGTILTFYSSSCFSICMPTACKIYKGSTNAQAITATGFSCSVSLDPHLRLLWSERWKWEEDAGGFLHVKIKSRVCGLRSAQKQRCKWRECRACGIRIAHCAPQAVLDQPKKHVLFENQHQASLAEAWLSLCKGKVLRWGSVRLPNLNPNAEARRGLKRGCCAVLTCTSPPVALPVHVSNSFGDFNKEASVLCHWWRNNNIFTS